MSIFCCSGQQQQQHQNVFDRRAKLLQKERAAANPLVADYDFLKEEIGYRHVFIFSLISGLIDGFQVPSPPRGKEFLGSCKNLFSFPS
jgi:hypothetical protein